MATGSENTRELFPAGERVAKLTNVGLALAALAQVENITEVGAPHMAVLSGPPGFGKTQAAIHLSHPAGKNMVFVAVRMFETTKTLAEQIALELGVGVKPGMTVATLYDAIIRRLPQINRGLIFDEVDYIAQKSTMDFIRTIHDNTTVPIVLIGEEQLKTKLLRHHERFHDRVVRWADAQPCDLADVRKLVAFHQPKLTFTPDMLAALHSKSTGVARRVFTELKALEETCKRQATDTPTVDMLGAFGKGAR